MTRVCVETRPQANSACSPFTDIEPYAWFAPTARLQPRAGALCTGDNCADVDAYSSTCATPPVARTTSTLSGPIALRSSGRALPVLDGVGVRVEVAVDDTDAVAETDEVAVAADVGVADGDAPELIVDDGDAVAEPDGETVEVDVPVEVTVGVLVGVEVGVPVDDGVCDGVGEMGATSTCRKP